MSRPLFSRTLPLSTVTPVVFMGLAIGLRALDGLVSAFEVNEGIELLKTGVLMHDPQWFRTMWDDQPGTLMWILSWLFRLTGPDVAIGRWWVIGVTAA
ncbi:MAG: hypothetical protein EBV83_09925, partial [Verrucomicrobia bacterium]|nr:hypothetical protein [Verrucomicrobiota bacterium]